MNNNKKILKRTVAAFLAAVNIFNFAGGSGKAVLWKEDRCENKGIEYLFNDILEDIDIKKFYEDSNNFFTESEKSYECYNLKGNDQSDSCYFLKINDDKFNELDELSKDDGTLIKICIYNIDEDVSKEIKDELYQKLDKINNILFIKQKEFIKEYCKKILNGTILFPDDEEKVSGLLQLISNLISSKLEESIPNDISELISKIKNDEFNEILLELFKRKDIFISISKILNGLVGVLKGEKDSFENNKEKKLTYDVLSNGLSYKDNNNECTFSLIDEDDFLGDIDFDCDGDTLNINNFIKDLIDEKFIDQNSIEKLEPIKLNDYDEENNEENKEILDQDTYIKKIDEYIKTLEKIIEVISIHFELEEMKTKNEKLDEEKNSLSNQLANLNQENKKLKSSSTKWKIFAGCGYVGTLLGLVYILKNELSNKCSTAHKKVLALKNKMLNK